MLCLESKRMCQPVTTCTRRVLTLTISINTLKTLRNDWRLAMAIKIRNSLYRSSTIWKRIGRGTLKASLCTIIPTATPMAYSVTGRRVTQNRALRSCQALIQNRPHIIMSPKATGIASWENCSTTTYSSEDRRQAPQISPSQEESSMLVAQITVHRNTSSNKELKCLKTCFHRRKLPLSLTSLFTISVINRMRMLLSRLENSSARLSSSGHSFNRRQTCRNSTTPTTKESKWSHLKTTATNCLVAKMAGNRMGIVLEPSLSLFRKTLASSQCEKKQRLSTSLTWETLKRIRQNHR